MTLLEPLVWLSSCSPVIWCAMRKQSLRRPLQTISPSSSSLLQKKNRLAPCGGRRFICQKNLAGQCQVWLNLGYLRPQNRSSTHIGMLRLHHGQPFPNPLWKGCPTHENWLSLRHNCVNGGYYNACEELAKLCVLHLGL